MLFGLALLPLLLSYSLMPPPIGTHSKASQAVASKMYEIFRDSIGDGCTAEQAVAAFVDMPGVSAALGFAAGTPACDVKTGAQLLGNMKASYEGPLSTNGTRYGGQREIAEAAASVISGPGLNAASVGRIVGISPELLKKGAQLKAENETAGPSKACSSVNVVREHSYPLQTGLPATK